MDSSYEARRLADLRERRGARRPTGSMGDAFASAAKELERQRRRTGAVAGAWEAVCPAELIDRTAIEGVSRGVLTIRVADASTRFQLDRFMRGGGEMEVIRRSPSGVRRVKLVVGAVD